MPYKITVSIAITIIAMVMISTYALFKFNEMSETIIISPQITETPLPYPTETAQPTRTLLPRPTYTPLPKGAHSSYELTYILIDKFGPHFYCDPDEYPVQRQDEQEAALEHFPEIQADSQIYFAILNRLNLDIHRIIEITPALKLTIYREFKSLRGVTLERQGEAYTFGITNAQRGSKNQTMRIEGTITQSGVITVASRKPYFGECPICLAKSTRIDTPSGSIPVDALQIGMQVFTANEYGSRIFGTVLQISQTKVPPTHQVISLILEDGRKITVSPGHPLFDGRMAGSLKSGDMVDGSRVTLASLVPYQDTATYDILVSGPTSAYFAGGILMQSTIK